MPRPRLSRAPVASTVLGLCIASTPLLVGCAPNGSQGSADVSSPDATLEAPKLREYRVYRITSERERRGVESGRFDGLLALRSLPDEAKLKPDSLGNLRTGWLVDEDRLISFLVSPDRSSTSVVTVSPDGTTSSALDADGDGVADLVDIDAPGLPRAFFVTASLGQQLLENWAAGIDPLCRENSELLNGAVADFRCRSSEDDGGESGNGAASSNTGVNAGTLDPLDALCDRYQQGNPLAGRGTMAHGGHGYGRWTYAPYDLIPNDNGGPRYFEMMRVHFDADGNHVSTYRDTLYFDEDANLIREVNERIDHEGNGRRVITDYGDGPPKRHEETFETEVHPNGQFPRTNHEPGASEDEEGPDWPTEPEDYDGWEDRPPHIGAEGSETNPGPEPDHDAAMAELCAQRESAHRSGAEAAADTDPTEIEIDCDDFSRSSSAAASSAPRLCGLRWSSRDHLGLYLDLDVPSTECGSFAQPGPDGTCQQRAIDRLRGAAASIAAANFEDVTICDPLVCDPQLLRSEIGQGLQDASPPQ